MRLVAQKLFVENFFTWVFLQLDKIFEQIFSLNFQSQLQLKYDTCCEKAKFLTQ